MDEFDDPDLQQQFEVFQQLGPERYQDYQREVLGPQGFAVMQGKLGVTKPAAGPLAGASLYDNAADSIRAARSAPMAQETGDVYARQSGALGSMIDQLGKQRDAGLKSLNDAYAESAPDKSEKWLSIAAALLSPTQTGKTSESIANALGVYAQHRGAERSESREKSLALAKLAAQYDLKGADLMARMANSPTGRRRVTLNPIDGTAISLPAPDEVAYPTNEQEYKALAPGTPYVIPSGPEAGKILYKGAA